jgi:hypothetical protein
MMHELLLLHAVVTWMLTGLIWTIQIVHYPLFEQVGEDGFVRYHARHMRRITWVAGPLMLAEAGSAALLFFLGERSPWFILGLVALAAVWVSTLLFQVPLHDRLTRGYDRKTIRRLTFTNAIRTLGWTLRAACLLAMLRAAG